jgi:serine/threonine protein kinase
VALWVLPREFTKTLPAIRHELERIRELAHPNIVRVVDFGQHADRLFVASALTDGETLRSILNAIAPERLTLAEADSVVEDVGFALSYAHENDIVHGDVRPENVIVTSDQRIKLANFAQAALARDTAFSASPLDDTRALAALAYELYCGAPPHAGTGGKVFKRLPARRRKAIESGLRGSMRTVPEFLASAGLSVETRRVPAREPHRLDPPPVRRSSWRFALPAVIAALAIWLYAGSDIDWPALLSTANGIVERNPDAQVASTAARTDGESAGRAPNEREPTTPDGAAAPPVTALPAAPEPSGVGEAVPAATTPAENTESSTARIKKNAPPTTRPRSAGTAAPEGVRLSASAVTVRESQGIARIDIVRAGSSARALEVAWWTSDGTAHAEDDYAGLGARIETFAPGETKRSVFIPLAADSVAEAPETFFLHVAPGSKANVDRQLTAEIRIVDDDS